MALKGRQKVKEGDFFWGGKNSLEIPRYVCIADLPSSSLAIIYAFLVSTLALASTVWQIAYQAIDVPAALAMALGLKNDNKTYFCCQS